MRLSLSLITSIDVMWIVKKRPGVKPRPDHHLSIVEEILLFIGPTHRGTPRVRAPGNVLYGPTRERETMGCIWVTMGGQ